MKVRDRSRRLRDANRALAHVWPEGWRTRGLQNVAMGLQPDLVRAAEVTVDVVKEREPFFALAS